MPTAKLSDITRIFDDDEQQQTDLYLPTLPKAPLPEGLKNTPPKRTLLEDSVEAHVSTMRPAIEIGKKIGAFSQAGAQEAKEGFGELTGADKSIPQRAQGLHRMIAGSAQAASPALLVPLTVALKNNPVGTVATMGAGMLAQQAVERGAKAVGVPEGVAQVMGDVAGLPGYAGVMGGAAKALRNSSLLRTIPKKAAEETAETVAGKVVPVSAERAATQKGSLSLPSVAEIKSKAQDALLNFEEKVADRYARIRDLETAADIAPEDSAFIGARQFGGHAGKIQDKLIDLRNILRPAKKDGILDDAIEYAKLERHEELSNNFAAMNKLVPEAQKLNALGYKPDEIATRLNVSERAAKRLLDEGEREYVIEGGKSINDVLAGKAALEQKYGVDGMKKVNEFNQKLRDYNRSLLDELKQSGILSAEAYDSMVAANQKYIPFRRLKYMKELADKDRIPAGSNAFSVASQDVVHGVKGSEDEIFDPIQSIVKNTYRVKSLVERNEVAKKMAAHADRPEFAGVVMKLKPTAQVAENFEPVSYMQDGVVHKVAVPKGVGEAMKQMGKEEADIITRSMGWFARALRTGVTLDPVFMVGNIIRDYQTATAAARLHGLGFTPADWAVGLISSATRGIPQHIIPTKLQNVAGENTYRQFLRSGGAFGGFYHHGNLPQTAKGLTESTGAKVLKTVANPAELMRVIGETFELAPRLGTFRKAIKQGQGDVGAGWTARNATVDFERAGMAIRPLNMMIPFLNARLQGTLNLKRAAQEAPMATAMRLGYVAGLPAMAAYFNNRLNYPQILDSISDWEKRGNFIVIYGPGKDAEGNFTDVVKIPKGEVGPIVNTIEDMLDYWYGKDQKSFRKKAVEFFNNISPIEFAEDGDPSGRKVMSSIAPPIIKAGVEIGFGKSMYTGRDIVPKSKVRQPSTPSQQYTAETGLPFVKGAQGLSSVGAEVSPMALEHTAGTLFGHLGRRAAQLSPTEASWQRYKQGDGSLLGMRFGKVQEGMEKRFFGAHGQSQTSKNFESSRANESVYNDRANAVQRAADNVMSGFKEGSLESITPKLQEAFENLRKQYPNEQPAKLSELLVDEVTAEIEARQKGLDGFEKSLLRLPTEVRAKTIIDQIGRIQDATQRAALLERYFDKKIITQKVAEEMSRLQ